MFETLPIRPDVLVIGLGLVLYLTDLSVRIYSNEVAFVGSGAAGWSVLTPRNGFYLAQRYFLLPSVLDPGKSHFVSRWPHQPDESLPDSLEQPIRTAHAALGVPRFICRLLLPEIFLLLPAVYIFRTNDLQVLVVLLLVYAQIIFAVAWLFVAGRRIGLPLGRRLFWAFESLVCIPYAINLHRKVAHHLLEKVTDDALGASEVLLPVTVQGMFRDELLAKARAHQDLEEAGSRRGEALQQFERRLLESNRAG